MSHYWLQLTEILHKCNKAPNSPLRITFLNVLKIWVRLTYNLIPSACKSITLTKKIEQYSSSRPHFVHLEFFTTLMHSQQTYHQPYCIPSQTQQPLQYVLGTKPNKKYHSQIPHLIGARKSLPKQSWHVEIFNLAFLGKIVMYIGSLSVVRHPSHTCKFK